MALNLELGSFLNGTLAGGETSEFLVSSVLYFVTAVVFQVHVGRLNGSVGIGPTSDPSSHVVNQGVTGFITHLRGSQSSVRAFVQNRDLTHPISYQIGARILTKADPVPGGCALRYPQPHVPLLLTGHTGREHQWFGRSLRLEWPGPDRPYSRNDLAEGHCEDKDLFTQELEFHLLVRFLHIHPTDLTPSDIFTSVQTFSSPADTRTAGSKVCKLDGGVEHILYAPSWPLRSFVASIVVENKTSDGVSTYIPVVISDGTTFQESILSIWSTRIFFGVVALIGLLLVFLGHYFFRCSQAAIGFFLTTYITFVFLFRFLDWDASSLYGGIGISTGAGLLGGLLTVLAWESLGSPFLASLNATLVFGLTLGVTLSYYAFDNLTLLKGRVYIHFLALACIILLTPAFLLFFKKLGHIIPCAGLGGFAVVISLSYFSSGTIHYVVIRSFQRFTLPWFQGNWCFIVPFGTTDMILCIAWVVLVGVGTLSQVYLTRGQSPFPATSSTHPCVRLCRLMSCCGRSGGDIESEPLVIDDPATPPTPSAPPVSEYGAIA